MDWEVDYRSPSLWDGDRPNTRTDETDARWLDEAKANGIKKAFIIFHYPDFARSGLGPIPEPDNPHKLIASYAKDMEVVVFNGHVHTTEMYDVEGVKYLMMGGGGAEQDPILPGRTSIKVPADYPPDLYWKGQPPKEEYNYVLVDVQPDQKTKFTLNRFRPWWLNRLPPRRCSLRRAVRCRARMATTFVILHGLVAVVLLGAITHQTLAVWAPSDVPPRSFFGRFRAVPSAAFANAIIILYLITALLRCRLSVLQGSYPARPGTRPSLVGIGPP